MCVRGGEGRVHMEMTAMLISRGTNQEDWSQGAQEETAILERKFIMPFQLLFISHLKSGIF